MDFESLQARNYWSFPICLVWLIPYLSLAVVALFWPADHAFAGIDFRNSQWVRSVPSISAYVSKSAFPSTVAAYFILAPALFFPAFLVALCSRSFFMGNAARTTRYFERFGRCPPVLMCFVVLLIAMLLTWGSWVQPGYQFGLLPLHEKRWALALGGPFFGFYSVLLYWVSGVVYTARLWCVVVEEAKDGVE